MYFLELRILSNQRYRCLIQHISQALSPVVADPTFSVMFTGIIRHDRISRQFLQLFGIIKTSNVPNLCNKTTDCNQSDPFDCHQLINIWDLL